MAYFAKLGTGNIAEQVTSVHNNELLDNGIESEQKGIQFLKSLYGQYTSWKQTSYNTRNGEHYLSDNSGLSDTQNKAFRKNYAGMGYTYDETRDAFIPPKPYNSWILNEETCQWEAPVTRPDNKTDYIWNELTLSWDLIII